MNLAAGLAIATAILVLLPLASRAYLHSPWYARRRGRAEAAVVANAPE